MRLANDLHRGIESGELRLLCQPILLTPELPRCTKNANGSGKPE